MTRSAASVQDRAAAKPTTEQQPSLQGDEDAVAAARAELAKLERERDVTLPREAREASEKLRKAGEWNNAAEVTAQRDILRRNTWRHNELVNLIMLAKWRVATALADQTKCAADAEPLDLGGLSIEDAVAEAERHVSDLQRERASLPAALRSAAGAADEGLMTAARQRLDALPGAIFVAQVRLLRLQAAQADAEAENVRKDQQPALSRLDETAAALATATEAHAKARNAFDVLRAEERDAKSEAATYRRRLLDLLNEQGRDKGPIVRSQIHAGRGLGDG